MMTTTPMKAKAAMIWKWMKNSLISSSVSQKRQNLAIQKSLSLTRPIVLDSKHNSLNILKLLKIFKLVDHPL
jgi:hypothetical protein